MKTTPRRPRLLTAVCLAGLSALAGCQIATPGPPAGRGETAPVTPAAASPVRLSTPAIPGVVDADTRIELLGEGFSGTEGPIGLADGSFAFTETNANRITRITAEGTRSTFLEDTNGANGLALAANGDVVAVQVLQPRVGVVYPPHRRSVLAEQFEGASFGRPNDLVLDRQGRVYFTDSGANTAPAPGSRPAAKPAVYRFSAPGGLQRLAADIERPNGIQLSPDETVLYVANTWGEHVLAFDIAADGSVGPRRNFAKLAGWTPTAAGGSSGADGLAVDASGRVYVASTAGVQVFSQRGDALGTIVLPKPPQNLAFAGPDKRTLYIVGRGAAYRIPVLTAGVASRAK